MSLLASLERRIAKLQGKGWGAQTVDKEVATAARFIRKNASLCIDIGGNKGLYTQALRGQFPDAKIVTFEPAPTNIAILEHMFADDTGITVEGLAVAEHATRATLFSNEAGSGLASLTQRDLRHAGIPFDEKVDVEVIRFEDYWKATLNSAHIDFLKLDIEGHELSALKGLGEAMSHTDVIQFEFGGCNIDTRTYLRDFWNFFQEQGFDMYLVGPLGPGKIKRYREQIENFATANYLAVRR